MRTQKQNKKKGFWSQLENEPAASPATRWCWSAWLSARQLLTASAKLCTPYGARKRGDRGAGIGVWKQRMLSFMLWCGGNWMRKMQPSHWFVTHWHRVFYMPCSWPVQVWWPLSLVLFHLLPLLCELLHVSNDPDVSPPLTVFQFDWATPVINRQKMHEQGVFSVKILQLIENEKLIKIFLNI